VEVDGTTGLVVGGFAAPSASDSPKSASWHNVLVQELPPADIKAGRPRDPDIEDRVYDAAIAIYSQVGWAGFNFAVISRAAGIGKSAMYRRWSSREELLADTLKARWLPVEEINTGHLRDDLRRLAMLFLTLLSSSYGSAHVQMQADRLHFEEVRTATDDYFRQLIRLGRQIVRRAVARGELPTEMSPALVMDLVVGGAMNHVMSTPASLRAEMESRMSKFGDELVEAVLRGVSARTPVPAEEN
jgi:AcrR family transcriptional regulator